MIKIQIDVLPDDKNIDIYCYIEDLSFKGEQFKQLKEVELVEKGEDQYAFQLKIKQGALLEVNQDSLLEIFLSNEFVLLQVK